ncbi:MAG TPA: DUF6152 family protein [Steroidobacteraceae bacterium]|nr:DUF6152 family protein [Steroidobacteraceae bacterium]
MNAVQQIVGATALFVAAPCLAHHSMAMFDATKTIALRGTVKEFQWTNPHCFIQLLVPEAGKAAAAGQVIEWSIELNSPLASYRLGFKPGTFKTGDNVTIVINPVKDGTAGGQFRSATDSAGRPLPAGKEPV